MPPLVPPFGAKKLCSANNPDASKLKLYKLGNVSDKVTDLRGGICAAMCLLWFKRIFQTQYRDVEWKLKDDADAAKTIFLQYTMTQRTGSVQDKEMELYKNYGMTLYAEESAGSDKYFAESLLEQGGKKAEDWIKLTPELTCFSIGAPKHAMAAFWKKGAAFFFDPNQGVFEMSNINDFAEEVIDSIYQNYYKGTDESFIFFYKVVKSY